MKLSLPLRASVMTTLETPLKVWLVPKPLSLTLSLPAVPPMLWMVMLSPVSAVAPWTRRAASTPTFT